MRSLRLDSLRSLGSAPAASIPTPTPGGAMPLPPKTPQQDGDARTRFIVGVSRSIESHSAIGPRVAALESSGAANAFRDASTGAVDAPIAPSGPRTPVRSFLVGGFRGERHRLKIPQIFVAIGNRA